MYSQNKDTTTRTAREYYEREARLEHTLALDGWVFQPGYVKGRAVARKAYRHGPDLVLPVVQPRPRPRPRLDPPVITDMERVARAARMLVRAMLRNAESRDDAA